MTPERYYEHKQHTFDSYCKKVLKCEAWNGYREISRRQKQEVPFSELPEEAFLMFWFLEMADREIGEIMHMARRTVNTHKRKAYRLLIELMGGEADD